MCWVLFSEPVLQRSGREQIYFFSTVASDEMQEQALAGKESVCENKLGQISAAS